MRIPALLLLSILVVNSLFFPAATDILVSLGPLAISREGADLRAHLGGPRAGRLPGLGHVPVHDPRRRHARDADRARREPSDLVRRPLGGPDGARGCRRAPARSSRRNRHAGCRSRARSCGGSGRSCRSSGRSCSARSWTRASGRSRSRRAGSGRGPGGPPIASSPTRRSTAGCALLILVAAVAIVLVALGRHRAMTAADCRAATPARRCSSTT